MDKNPCPEADSPASWLRTYSQRRLLHALTTDPECDGGEWCGGWKKDRTGSSEGQRNCAEVDWVLGSSPLWGFSAPTSAGGVLLYLEGLCFVASAVIVSLFPCMFSCLFSPLDSQLLISVAQSQPCCWADSGSSIISVNEDQQQSPDKVVRCGETCILMFDHLYYFGNGHGVFWLKNDEWKYLSLWIFETKCQWGRGF